jgi:hypothetical protein
MPRHAYRLFLFSSTSLSTVYQEQRNTGKME